MKCSICNILCINPNGLCISSNNIATVKEDGTIICSGCLSVLDMMGSTIKNDNTTIKEENVKVIKINSINSVFCPKCKDRFSNQVCKCGFKNPLFRK
jgi:hypothetical protein